MFSSYLGLVAMGCEFIALGLFCSTLTRNQIVAAVFALVALLVLWVIGAVGDYLPAALRRSVEYLGTMQHLERLLDRSHRVPGPVLLFQHDRLLAVPVRARAREQTVAVTRWSMNHVT